MEVTEKYAFLRGRHWLLPVAWVYRFVRALTRRDKRQGGVRELKRTFVKSSEMDEYTATLEQWGL